MTYGSNDKGEATIKLTPEEHKRFKKGETVSKVTGCSSGEYKIVLYMRPLKSSLNSCAIQNL
jgi:hypothetical protein